MAQTIIQVTYEELTTAVRNCLLEAINEIKSLPTPDEINDRCLLPEACEITGLSRSMIYKLSMDDSIPRQRYGGRRLVFSRKELKKWMTSRTVTPVSVDTVMSNNLQQSAKKKQ